MEQQLIESTINITPDTMEQVLAKVQGVLNLPNLEQSCSLDNIVKSLFYGLWNFDKMINQHNLSTKISELLVKVNKKNSLAFFKAMFMYLSSKWNLIDKHRINKFMQLVRYLIELSIKMCQKHKMSRKKVENILIQTVFTRMDIEMGLAYHITDIYWQIIDKNVVTGATLDDLNLFQKLLLTHSNEHFRLHIIEHVYQKQKKKIVQNQSDLQTLQIKMNHFCNRFIELAKQEQKDLHRKNLYTIVGFIKSQQMSFKTYLHEKEQKAQIQKQKRRKKISKGKKEEIKKNKQKRKIKNKRKNHQKILSIGKFQNKNLEKQMADN